VGLGAAEALREVFGVPLQPEQRAGHEQAVTTMRTAPGEEAFAAPCIQSLHGSPSG
jgi:hypothetical protein